MEQERPYTEAEPETAAGTAETMTETVAETTEAPAEAAAPKKPREPFFRRQRRELSNAWREIYCNSRVRRIRTRTGCTEEEARTMMERGDASRADYYNYYSLRTWGAAATYHLCVNTSALGDEATADFILQFAARKLKMTF